LLHFSKKETNLLLNSTVQFDRYVIFVLNLYYSSITYLEPQLQIHVETYDAHVWESYHPVAYSEPDVPDPTADLPGNPLV